MEACKGQCKLFGMTCIDIKLTEKQIREGNYDSIVEPFFQFSSKIQKVIFCVETTNLSFWI
jgi:hypothetical protein